MGPRKRHRCRSGSEAMPADQSRIGMDTHSGPSFRRGQTAAMSRPHCSLRRHRRLLRPHRLLPCPKYLQWTAWCHRSIHEGEVARPSRYRASEQLSLQHHDIAYDDASSAYLSVVRISGQHTALSGTAVSRDLLGRGSGFGLIGYNYLDAEPVGTV
jgi:hypothetical protein